MATMYSTTKPLMLLLRVGVFALVSGLEDAPPGEYPARAASSDIRAAHLRLVSGSHSSVGQSVRLITVRSAVRARVGPF